MKNLEKKLWAKTGLLGKFKKNFHLMRRPPLKKKLSKLETKITSGQKTI